jgi:hypothetical protein
MAGITMAAVTSGKLLRAQRPAASIARAACMLMLLSFGLMAGVLRWLPAEPLALSAALLPLGLGLGLLFPIVTVVAQRVSPAQHMGIATAAPIMLRSLGGAAGVSLLAALLAHLVKRELAAPGALSRGAAADAVTAALAHGLQSVFGCAAAAVLLALVATNWLVKKQPREGLAKDGALEATS